MKYIIEAANHHIEAKLGITALLILPGWVQQQRLNHRPRLAATLGQIASQENPALVLCNLAKEEMESEDRDKKEKKKVDERIASHSIEEFNQKRQEQKEGSYK